VSVLACVRTGAVVVGVSVLLAASAPLRAVTYSRTAPGQPPRGALRQLAAGKFLVAARNLPDPNFSEAVVLLVDVNEQGAMGIILNRPTQATLTEILPGLTGSTAAGVAYFGGPVQVAGVLALLRSELPRTDCRKVVADVYLVNTREVLDEVLAAGTGPDRFRVYAGYAGWEAAQLQREAALGAWHVFEGDPDVVFDPQPDSVWQRQIRRTADLVAEHSASPLLASR
jgi:putative transcriptional regulator